VRRAVASLIVLIGVVACGGNAQLEPGTVPSDFQVEYSWNNGVSRVGPDFLTYQVSLPTTGSGTIHCTFGHPSSNQQEEWTETFEVTADDLQALYATMHEVGLFTKTWPQAEPVPGLSGGSSIRVVADGGEYRVPSVLADSSDADSIAVVYQMIRSMVPQTIWDEIETRQAQYIEDHDS